MAARTVRQFNTKGRRPTAGRLSPLLGGGLGLLGFSLAVFFGLAANNSFSQIIERALVVSIALAVVGAVAGSIASRVLSEHVAGQAELAGDKASYSPQSPHTSDYPQTSKTAVGHEIPASEPASGVPANSRSSPEFEQVPLNFSQK